MRLSFQPRLVNPTHEDPALYIPLAYHGNAMLFDAGELALLTNRELLKVDHVFITHTHMDHFSGFDRLLRLCLGRDKTLNLFGPEFFLSNLEGKLSSYQWNLVEKFTYPLIIRATEITASGQTTRTYRCRNRFEPTQIDSTQVDPNWENLSPFTVDTILETPSFTVTAAILDHQIPCLGLALKEHFHINIIKPALTKLGLAPGPWLKTFKRHLFLKHSPDTAIDIPATHTRTSSTRFLLGQLTDELARITPGQKIAYITDVGFTPENTDRIERLAWAADHLFIEAAFLDKDRDIATGKYHLTARQAGYLAALTGVKRLSVFHFSPRYEDHYDRLDQEAQTAFQHYRLHQKDLPP